MFDQIFFLSFPAQSEVDVYKAALRWLNYVKPSRIGQLDSLIKCIRWVHMTGAEIVDVKHLDPGLFSEPAVSTKAAMGQWHRDLLRRGIQLPPTAQIPSNRCEESQLPRLRNS